MRLRTKSTLTSNPAIVSLNLSKSCASEGTWTNIGSVNAYETGDYVLMQDVVVPKFRERVANGEVFFNPMHRVLKSYSGDGNGFHIRDVVPACTSPLRYSEFKREGPMIQQFTPSEYNPETGRYHLRIDPLIPESVVSSLVTEASTAALAEAGRSSSNGWETLAESKKSLSMISQGLSSLYKILFTRGIAKRAKEQGNLYLLYRYGVKPVMKYVEDSLEALEDLAASARVSNRSKLTHNEDRQYVESHVHGNLQTAVLVTKTHTVIVRATHLTEISKDTFRALGFTAGDLWDLPWELVKYSFVVDWALNIGDRLSALAPQLGVESLGSCVVVHHVITNTYSALGTICTDGRNIVLRPVTGSCVGLRDEKYREPIGAPGIVFKSDVLGKNPMTRLADAAALLAQRLI